MESDQFGQNSEANGHEQNNSNSDNDNSNDHSNDHRKVSSENVNTTHLRNNSSYISLRNYKIPRKVSRYLYLDKDNTCPVNAKNNDKKYIQKEIITIPNTFIQKAQSGAQKSAIEINRVNYVYAMNDDNSLISLWAPYNREIYAFSELKFYAEHYDELEGVIDQTYNSEIRRIDKVLYKNMKECSDQTREMNTLVYHLENPEINGIRESEYSAKKQKYKEKIDTLQQCLKRNYKKNEKSIKESRSIIYNTVNDISCIWLNLCQTYIYYDMVTLREMKVKQYNVKSITSFINETRKIQKSGEDIIKRVKQHLNGSLASETTEFVLEEIKYIVEKMDLHLRKVTGASDTIRKLSKQEFWNYFQRFTLQTEFFKLADVYSSFKFSTENLEILRYVSEKKKEKLDQTFGKFVDGLNNIISIRTSSLYSISGIHAVMLASEELLKSIESLHTSIYEQIKEHILYSNAQIEETKKILDQKMLKLEEYLKDTKGLITTIKERFNLNITESEKIEKKRNETNKINTSLEKCKKLLDFIGTIKSRNPMILETGKKLEEYSKQISIRKTEFQQLETSINEHVRKIKELIENEKQRRSMREEIKKHLKYFSETLHNIKEMISQKEEVEKYILSIEILIKGVPYLSDEFTTQKTELRDRAKSIIYSFYHENLQIFVEKLAEFNTKHQALNKEEKTKEETQEIYEQTKGKYQELVTMNCDGIAEMLNNLRGVVNSLSELKKKIIEQHAQNINTHVS
ncbi:hypothetical protein C922_05762, partial [Plasmodium inui San Antonio 1]